jgi:hypothetical protein
MNIAIVTKMSIFASHYQADFATAVVFILMDKAFRIKEVSAYSEVW